MVGAGRASMEEEGPLLTLFLLPAFSRKSSEPEHNALPHVSFPRGTSSGKKSVMKGWRASLSL